MERRKIVAGNWKMNLDLLEAMQLAKDITAAHQSFTCDVVIAPPFLFLPEIERVVRKSKVLLGAQNCSDKEQGAFTGEVSANQLANLGVEYIIIGHSERREYYGETGEMLKEKLKLALKNDLKPIFCCGEPLKVRNNDEQKGFVKQQLQQSLFVFGADEIVKIIIAYEPVWAIGTGLNATAEQAQEIHSFIREQIVSKYSAEIAKQVRIIYGGSCKPDNAQDIFRCADVDGGLIGGASLNAKDFLAIIEATR